MYALPHTLPHTLHTLHYTHTALHTHTTHTLHTVHTCSPEAALLREHSFSVGPGVPYHRLLLMYALPHTLHTHTLHTHTLHTHTVHTSSPEAALLREHSFSVGPGVPYHRLLLMYALPHTLHTHTHTHYTHYTHYIPVALRQLFLKNTALVSAQVCPTTACFSCTHYHTHYHTHYTHTLHTHYTQYIPVALRQLFLVNTALVSAQVCPTTACFSCTHYHTHYHTHYTHTHYTHTTHSTYL